jgi:hypothetical protein
MFSKPMLGRKQSLLSPRFCRRCGGDLVRSGYETYRCVDCGTVRTPQVSNNDFIIIRPSQRSDGAVVVRPAWKRRWTLRRVALAFVSQAGAIGRVGGSWLLLAAAALWRQSVVALRSVRRILAVEMRLGAHWVVGRLAALRDRRTTLSYPDWDVAGLLPALNPSTLPVAIMVIAVLLAAALGGLLANALS